MKLSIITVNLNNCSGLRKTIDSVISQTFRDFEWIIIDGGSTDGSRELIEEYSEHFSYWVSEPDEGIYNAMNKGVAHATGEYCQFLNSGDWLEHKCVLENVFVFNASSDIIYGDLKVVSNGVVKEIRRYSDTLTFDYLLKYSLAHPCSFIRRTLLIDDPYNENLRIVSDWEFFIKMALSNRIFTHIPVIVSCFDSNGISSTSSELVKSERLNVERFLLPATIRNSYYKYQNFEQELSEGRLLQLIKLRHSHKILSKAITGVILLMEKIDSSN